MALTQNVYVVNLFERKETTETKTQLSNKYFFLFFSTEGLGCNSDQNSFKCLVFPPSIKKENIISTFQDTFKVRMKRKAVEEYERNVTQNDTVKNTKQKRGIKIVKKDRGEHQCNYDQCVEICKTIYYAVPIHLAQCYDNFCFCFPKKDLYPPVIKNFMKSHTLFGIQQPYE
ncbi:uncharacterized protein NPIL_506621 [Nephila pilipes]|uniref:Uncharacterized protein n=1 Tax=Nephila pilipes TaxID=299642 RepID=A0A8X6QEC4_NEPPI|nr:uncharacterized protein NPIL_506621 [Nephila pilipes]